MDNFIVEKYLMYVRDVKNGKIVFYIIEKRNVLGVTIKRVDGNKKETIYLRDIEDEFIRENVSKVRSIAAVAEIKYATKQLAALLRGESLDIIKYGDVKEYDNVSNEKYHIRTVRYYYNPKGKLFERLFNKKW